MDQLKTYLTKLKQSVIKDYLMTSREIIIKLIDTNLINGEEAFTLINDILVAEIKAAMETLKESSQSDSLHLKWNQDSCKDATITSTPWTNTWSTTGISGTLGSTGDCSTTISGIHGSAITASSIDSSSYLKEEDIPF